MRCRLGTLALAITPGTYTIPITAAGTSAGHTYTQTVNLTLIVTP